MNHEIFIIFLSFKSSDFGFSSKKVFFLQFLVDIFSLGSGSVDPHIFADPDLDPGRQNLADPMDPDPKHWFFIIRLHSIKINPRNQPF